MRHRKIELHQKWQAVLARVWIPRSCDGIHVLFKDDSVHVLAVQEEVHTAFTPDHRIHVELRGPFPVRVDPLSQAFAIVWLPQNVSMIVRIVRVRISSIHEQVRRMVLQDVDLPILRPGKLPTFGRPANGPPSWPRIYLGLNANPCIVLTQRQVTRALRPRRY